MQSKVMSQKTWSSRFIQWKKLLGVAGKRAERVLVEDLGRQRTEKRDENDKHVPRNIASHAPYVHHSTLDQSTIQVASM